MVNLTDDPVTWFAEKSGIHKTIVKKYFEELEKSGVDWQNLDIETIAEEIRDFSQTGGRLEHPELRKRLGLSPVIEKTAEIEAMAEEIESLLGDKPGVKTLLKRIYENKELSDKQKDELKQKIIAGAPEIATLIALYDGKEQDYAKRFLSEMVLGPELEPTKPVPEGKIEDYLIKYSYKEASDLAKENNLRISGSKFKIISKLLEQGII